MPGDDAPLTTRTDDDLMVLSRGGARDAFRALVRRHEGKAVAFGTRYLGSVPQARDAAQEAFVELYFSLNRYEPRGRFLSYWHQILLNQCRMTLRAASIRRAAHSQLGVLQPLQPLQPDEVLIAGQDQRQVGEAIERLSEKLRVVVALRFGAGLPLQGVADTLEVPLGTVKSRLFTALAELKTALKGSP